MSLEAAAALMCRLGCRTELLQSRARANVPTDLQGRGVGEVWEREGKKKICEREWVSESEQNMQFEITGYRVVQKKKIERYYLGGIFRISELRLFVSFKHNVLFATDWHMKNRANLLTLQNLTEPRRGTGRSVSRWGGCWDPILSPPVFPAPDHHPLLTNQHPQITFTTG